MTNEDPTMAALIGRWRTTGEVFGEDGVTVVGAMEGSDVYEWLGPTVVHHVDVLMDGQRTRALEVFEPFDAERGGFPSRAYDDTGGAESALAELGADGRWTFRSAGATATLTVAGDELTADWVREAGQPWMRLRLRRADASTD